MRVNIYAEEMTPRVEIVTKVIDGVPFTGLRFYLELPTTVNSFGVKQLGEAPHNVKGPFIHRPGDDDSSAVTFWGKSDLREVMGVAMELLNAHYAQRARAQEESGRQL